MNNKTRKLFYPKKYYTGLSSKNKTLRKKEINRFGLKHWKDKTSYIGFTTDKGIKTQKSKYTVMWNSKYPHIKSLKDKSKITGVPLKYIQESYNRGMAAWRTGHRPGATQAQWGYARVNSFLLCGKTYHTTDSDLVKKAKNDINGLAKKWWNKC